jgi:hypothetical protein
VLKLVVQQMLAEPMQTPLLSKSGSGLEAQLDSAAQMDPRAVENIALIFEMVSHVRSLYDPLGMDMIKAVSFVSLTFI